MGADFVKLFLAKSAPILYLVMRECPANAAAADIHLQPVTVTQ